MNRGAGHGPRSPYLSRGGSVDKGALTLRHRLEAGATEPVGLVGSTNQCRTGWEIFNEI
jgi:hypothetical protein